MQRTDPKKVGKRGPREPRGFVRLRLINACAYPRRQVVMRSGRTKEDEKERVEIDLVDDEGERQRATKQAFRTKCCSSCRPLIDYVWSGAFGSTRLYALANALSLQSNPCSAALFLGSKSHQAGWPCTTIMANLLVDNILGNIQFPAGFYSG